MTARRKRRRQPFNVTPQAARSVLFVVGLVGIVEQEAMRVLLEVQPSDAMLAVFTTWTGTAAVLTAVGRNGDRNGGD